MKQLAVDLVILNEHAPSYLQELQTLLETVVRTSPPCAAATGRATHGGVFSVRADLTPSAQRDVLQAAARAILLSRRGTLSEQVLRAERAEPAAVPSARHTAVRKSAAAASPSLPDLEFFNGLGGFAAKGREYVTILDEGRWSPAPWINVVANAAFGFQVSESGSGYTWSVNSRENQLTAWSNDPVSDPAGEVVYVRDDETGEVWSATALPIRQDSETYVARHGQGYSRFTHRSHGVAFELLQLVPLDDPVKICRLTLTNASGRRRRLSVTAYVEWVLGASRSVSAPFVVTEIDPQTGAMLARNPWSVDFGSRVAFADLGGRQTAWTADRTEFLGRHGTPEHPAALERGQPLSGRVGVGLDPCSALQTTIELAADERADVVFLLGQAASREAATQLIARYRACDVEAVLAGGGVPLGGGLGARPGSAARRRPRRPLHPLPPLHTPPRPGLGRAALYQAGGAYRFCDPLPELAARP